jgi:hypothetical protein
MYVRLDVVVSIRFFRCYFFSRRGQLFWPALHIVSLIFGQLDNLVRMVLQRIFFPFRHLCYEQLSKRSSLGQVIEKMRYCVKYNETYRKSRPDMENGDERRTSYLAIW